MVWNCRQTLNTLSEKMEFRQPRHTGQRVNEQNETRQGSQQKRHFLGYNQCSVFCGVLPGTLLCPEQEKISFNFFATYRASSSSFAQQDSSRFCSIPSSLAPSSDFQHPMSVSIPSNHLFHGRPLHFLLAGVLVVTILSIVSSGIRIMCPVHLRR